MHKTITYGISRIEFKIASLTVGCQLLWHAQEDVCAASIVITARVLKSQPIMLGRTKHAK